MPSIEQTNTQIANLALSHCGVSKPLGNIQTEKNVEAMLCRQFIDIARQDVLREFPWFFATKMITPAVVAQQPTNEWLYAYQYPQDALRLTRFMSWRLNNDTRQSRIPYRVMQPVPVSLSTLTTPPTSYSQTTGLWIYTNWPGLNFSFASSALAIEYTFDNKNISQWPPDFIMALSYKLAGLIVMTLTSGDPQNYMTKIDANYVQTVMKAKNDNLNEEQRPEEPQSEFIRARGGGWEYGIPGQQWTADPSGFNIQ